MTLRRRILDYALAGILLLIPSALLYANIKSPDNLNGFDQAVLRISSPLQAAVSWIVEGVGGLWNRYVWLVDVEEENRELRAENRRLSEALAAAERRAVDSEMLEELIGLKRRTPAESLGARVIATSINPHFRVVRLSIDRGESEVDVGMPVIASDGLVGRIQRAYGDYSDVLLASDPQSSIDVLIPRTGGRGVLTGLGVDDSYACKVEYLERDKEVVEGDLVVTSGLGNALPAGIPVGHIAAVKTVEYGLYQEVEVEPVVDFSEIGRVLVLLAPPPAPDPKGGVRERAPLASGVRPY